MVFEYKALEPTAVLLVPVVFNPEDKVPTVVLPLPVVLFSSADHPIATLLELVVSTPAL